MDINGTINTSAWGKLDSKLVQKKGVLGTIMHGTWRDIEEIHECGYPVWAKGVCPRSRNDFTFGTINEQILVSGVKTKKNDIIVADQSRAICVFNKLIHETLSLLEKISKQEDLLEDQVLNNNV